MVNVTGTTAGDKNNTSGSVSSTNGGTGNTATATLTVVAAPSIAKAFSPTQVNVDGTSTLTFTLTNPAANTVAESGVAFTDTLPSGLVVKTPNGLSNTCGGTATATAGTGSIQLTGGSVAKNSSCAIAVNVTPTATGTLVNTSGAVSSTNGGTGSTATATLTVVDIDLALINVPANITTVATGASGAVVSYTSPTATDEGGETPAVGCLPASGSTFAVGTTTVTCTATDADDSNSPVTATFTVTVTDSDLALHNVPANITTDATSSSGAVVTYTPPNATDEGGQTPAVSCDHPSGSTFAIGTTTVKCSASASDADDSNSPVSASFTVTVRDTDLALHNVPANITTNATGPTGAVVTYTPPTAVDEGSETPTVGCLPASGSLFAIGTTTVTCTTVDADDLNSPVTATFTVTVKGAAGQLTDLIAAVGALPSSTAKTVLNTQLADALTAEQAGNTSRVCLDLFGALRSAQTEQSYGQLTAAQAAQIINAANQVAAVVGCGGVSPARATGVSPARATAVLRAAPKHSGHKRHHVSKIRSVR